MTQRRAEPLQGRAATGREPLIATGPQAGNFFRIPRLLMALADRRRSLGRFPPLTHTLSVAARLLAAALLALLAGPIPPGRQPPRPQPRRFGAGWATVPGERMEGREPLLASLQETDPRTAMGRGLPPRRTTIMLMKDQGSANSRRSSPGSGVILSAPGRLGIVTSCPPALRPA